jgi:hypothetical protein
MSKKHLQRYIDEFAFRFNARAMDMGQKFFEIVQRISKYGNLSYAGLISTSPKSSYMNYEEGQTTEKTQTNTGNFQPSSWYNRQVKV